MIYNNFQFICGRKISPKQGFPVLTNIMVLAPVNVLLVFPRLKPKSLRPSYNVPHIKAENEARKFPLALL